MRVRFPTRRAKADLSPVSHQDHSVLAQNESHLRAITESVSKDSPTPIPEHWKKEKKAVEDG